MRGCAAPAIEDTKLLENTILNVFKLKDRDYLIPAIDWFNRGTASLNIFNSFICYFIVIDTISEILDKGKANFGLDYSLKTKEQIKQDKIKCIRNKIDLLLKEDPIRFVEVAYSECNLSTSRKIRILLERVFGESHSFINDMFKKKGKYSLYDIRNRIAHGDFSFTDVDEVKIVKKRFHEIKNISYELLIRIIFQINKDEKIPKWSNKHTAALEMSDPRSIQVTSHLNIFPNKDWKINSEWIE